MKTSIEFKADNDGNIVEVTTVTYTPQEWLVKAGEVYQFACEMTPGYGGRQAVLPRYRTITDESDPLCGRTVVENFTEIINKTGEQGIEE